LRKKYRNKRERHQIQVEMALKDWDNWLAETGIKREFADENALHLVSAQ
jgi:hypothetical protein